jgi:hypothetical protein
MTLKLAFVLGAAVLLGLFALERTVDEGRGSAVAEELASPSRASEELAAPRTEIAARSDARSDEPRAHAAPSLPLPVVASEVSSRAPRAFLRVVDAVSGADLSDVTVLRTSLRSRC